MASILSCVFSSCLCWFYVKVVVIGYIERLVRGVKTENGIEEEDAGNI